MRLALLLWSQAEPKVNKENAPTHRKCQADSKEKSGHAEPGKKTEPTTTKHNNLKHAGLPGGSV